MVISRMDQAPVQKLHSSAIHNVLKALLDSCNLRFNTLLQLES